MTMDRDYDVATVVRFAPGEVDVPAEEVRDETFRWIVDETEFGSANEIRIERLKFNTGASGAAATMLLSLLSGAAGRVTEKAVDFIVGRFREQGIRVEILDHDLDVDGLRARAAQAFDLRRSELSLVEARGSGRRHAAVFEDRDGRFYGVRIEGGGVVTIQRLREGDW
jgi:hypothetical protein